jgi:hypothetical protein
MGEEEGSFSFFTSALDGGECSRPNPTVGVIAIIWILI